MADLAGMKTALKQQFIDLYQLAVPETTQEEAIRRTLARLNLALGGQAELAGLDGATQTSLPADWQLALLEGAAARLLDYSLRSNLVRNSEDGHLLPVLECRADWLQNKFEDSLDFLRSLGLQTSLEGANATWEWKEEKAPYGYA
jgi:hypothetical protein